MRNDIIDECIDKIKSLIKLRCDDHTPYRGACVSCNSYHNPEELPDPEVVLEALEELKSVKVEKSYCININLCPDCKGDIIVKSSHIECSICNWSQSY